MAIVFYVGQLAEFVCSGTMKLLEKKDGIEEFGKFKQFFADLKKCKPEISFTYYKQGK